MDYEFQSPGQIVERIHVPFPLKRTKDLKRSSEFTRMVYDIEDKLTYIENQKCLNNT